MRYYHQKWIEMSVGLFLLMGILAFFFLTFRVSGLSQFWTTKNDGYLVQAEFSNVGGLKTRARVTISGVTIGRVEKIELDIKKQLALVWVRLQPQVSLSQDSQIRILTAGLLGDNYLECASGYSEKLLKEGSKIPVVQTTSGLVLEDLISRFLSNQISKDDKS